MSTNAKVQNLAIYLQQELLQRLGKLSTAVTVADITFDTDQNPLIKLGTGIAGAAGGMVKVAPLNWPLSQNIIGQQAPNYGSQSVIQYAREASVAANTMELQAAINLVVGNRGTQVEFYECTNGVVPDQSQIIAGNLKYTYQPSTQWGMTLEQ